jgi:cysteine desulfurase/selenocysteine lyase
MNKKDFPIFKNTKFYNKDLVYLDNASTTQKPQIVIDEYKRFYENYNANIYRGIYRLSEEATALYEESRKRVAKFINADFEEIIFTRNTTESINLLIYTFAKKNLKKEDTILLSVMEHHSNIIPWLILQKEIGFSIEYLDIDENFNLKNLEIIEKIKPKIISLCYISNVLGVKNDIEKVIKLGRKNNSYIIIDAAQAVSHISVDVKKLDCDFLVFSAHKMLGPTGVGILFGKKDILDKMPPFLGGGEMILSVSKDEFISKDVPYKFEAGTQNFSDVVVFKKSIDYLESLGMKKIEKYIKDLSFYTYDKLSEVPGIKIYGNRNEFGIYSFSLKKIHSHDISSFLDEDNIAIRAGHHCAEVLMKNLKVNSLSRVSIYIYNDESDIDKLSESLKNISKLF